MFERRWNLPDKGELESKREETFIDDIVQKSHIENELLASLDGIRTAFDGGAGCGRTICLQREISLQKRTADQKILEKRDEKMNGRKRRSLKMVMFVWKNR
ncbi:MAG: hypothetical protein K5697_07935 [Lachnospiraceae bacterium]|nr:hypothetical protein [Lachnospiraceae bacterium]